MKIIIALASMASVLAVATSAQATQYVVNGNFTELTNGPGKLQGSHPDTSATGWETDGYNFVDTIDPTANGEHGLELWDQTTVAADNAYYHTDNINTWNGVSPNGNGSYSASTDNFAVLEGDYGTVKPLYQTIDNLTVGETYTLSFDYAFGQQNGYSGGTTQSLLVNLGAAGSIDGSTGLWTFPNGATWTSATVNLPSHGFSGWSTETIQVKATSTSEVLSLLAQSSPAIPPFALVTDVSLIGGAVPEPATWGMMLVGFAAIGAAARRRRRAFASA